MSVPYPEGPDCYPPLSKDKFNVALWPSKDICVLAKKYPLVLKPVIVRLRLDMLGRDMLDSVTRTFKDFHNVQECGLGWEDARFMTCEQVESSTDLKLGDLRKIDTSDASPVWLHVWLIPVKPTDE